MAGQFIHRARFAAPLLLLAVLSCWKVEADLSVSSTDLNFGPAKDSVVVTVRNDSEDNSLTSGVTVLNYSFKPDKPWVKVTPASGTCGEMEKNSHNVLIDRDMMVFGENLATIKVTSNGGSSTIRVRAVKLVPGCDNEPDAPHTPSPAVAATGVSTNPELSWDGGDSGCSELTARYDIYFGTTSPPPFDHTDTLKVWSPGPLANNTLYYWRVVAKDANGSSSGAEWRFRTVCTLGPADVTLTSPANNATDVSVNSDLAWRGGSSRCAGITSTYDVYFGTSTPAPFHHSTATPFYEAGELDKDATYYWRIVARDSNGSVSSPEYSFTTEPVPCLTKPTSVSLLAPAQGATDVPLSQDLSWNGGNSQCAGLVATYDVYFGTETPPPFDHNNGSGKTWSPTLQFDTIYYWRVVAKDANGSVTSSERWFRTPCNLAPSALTLVSPGDGAGGVSVDANISWGGGNSRCAGLDSNYDVYFGTSTPPPFHHNNGSNKSWDPGTMSAGTTYYWKIIAKDDNGETAGPIWGFTTEGSTACTDGPSTVSLSLPADASTGMPIDTNVSWTGGNSQCEGLSATYDVYFGLTSSPPLADSDVESKEWNPGVLLPLTKYYWKVRAQDENGATTSSIRSFTTGLLPCDAKPSAVTIGTPANGATNVSTSVNLSWGGGNSQCQGLTATYDVYFGTQNPPSLDHDNGTTKTWDPGTLANATTYYWKIVATDENGNTSSAVWNFTTAPAACIALPTAPTITSPLNGASDVSTDADISWGGGVSQCPGLTATYDIYFGTQNPPPLDHNNGSSKTWNPGALADATTYYWRIVAKDSNGSTVGPVWSFNTEEAPCVTAPTAPTVASPANNGNNVSINANISWGAGTSTCPGLTATYDVYFGTTSPPSFKGGNGGTKSFEPGTLQYSTTYYWQIVAKDANGETPGPIWSFTTEEPCLSAPTAACSPSPANNRTGVNENTNLSWSCGVSECGLAVTYDVYLGTSATLSEADKKGSTVEKAWNLPKLNKSTKYYWKIVTRDANGSTSSAVWSFTTRS